MAVAPGGGPEPPPSPTRRGWDTLGCVELGRCPRCAHPFTSTQVAGYGILRSRPASQGGPRVELPCEGCGVVLPLVPHGDGRYALPGSPPPPPVPLEQRRPPWMAQGGEPDPEPVVVHPPPARPPPPEPEPPLPERPPPAADGFSAADALAVLGLGPTATRSDIERAFRERSRTCHPDKVAHLDADFQTLAESKFRRLKRAYDLLHDS